MRLLLIEDDRKAARLLAKGLQEEGFVVDVAPTGEDGEEKAAVNEYDLIVLDWLLPGKDGLAVCRALRAGATSIPILMLTARDSVADRVSGLSTGADDYLTKPFAFAELLARIRALLRRSRVAQPAVLRVADLTLDPATRRVTRGDGPVMLTPREYAILEALMRNAGEVVSRTRLTERVWDDASEVLDNLLDVRATSATRSITGRACRSSTRFAGSAIGWGNPTQRSHETAQLQDPALARTRRGPGRDARGRGVRCRLGAPRRSPRAHHRRRDPVPGLDGGGGAPGRPRTIHPGPRDRAQRGPALVRAPGQVRSDHRRGRARRGAERHARHGPSTDAGCASRPVARR